MPKGQHLSHHQQGIVKRYYRNLDTIALGKLQELVSELYLATDPKAAAKLWKSVDIAMSKLDPDPAAWRKIEETRDPKRLAELVEKLGREMRL